MHAAEEADVQAVNRLRNGGVGRQHMHLDTGRTQPSDSLARHQGIGVQGCHIHSRDAGLHQRIAARRRSAKVRAGFKSYPRRCAAHRNVFGRCVSQSHHFRMGLTRRLGKAFAKQSAVLGGDDTSDPGVGVRQSQRLVGNLECAYERVHHWFQQARCCSVLRLDPVTALVPR